MDGQDIRRPNEACLTICRSLLCPRQKQSGRVQEQSINAVFEPELVKLGNRSRSFQAP